jgi:catechol 2,3-dioxygenase-like lactoylglutathione lyase family enzyme
VLGRFLELSVQTPDIRASLAFYEKLGFLQAEVGEAWRHAYAVVSDGRLCLGLHESEESRTMLTFVRPNVLASLPELERLGVEFEFRHLGADRFNEVGWTAPCGHLIRLVEARTFSPPTARHSEGSSCGYFLEIGLPAGDLTAAKSYWERFGFVGMDEAEAPLPHVCCTSDTIDVGLYDRHVLRAPTLLFEAESPAANAARIALRGIEAGRRLPGGLASGTGAHYVAPEGTAILIMAQIMGQTAPQPV